MTDLFIIKAAVVVAGVALGVGVAWYLLTTAMHTLMTVIP